MKRLFAKMGIHNREKFFAVMWQFIKFGIVGVSNTLISLAIYYIFVFISKDLYLWGQVVGWVVSVFNAFYWNNKYVFRSEKTGFRSVLNRLFKTYLTYGATFLLTTCLLYTSLPVCCLAGPKPQNVPAGSIKFSLPVIRTSICPFGQTGKHPGHVRNFYGIIIP